MLPANLDIASCHIRFWFEILQRNKSIKVIEPSTIISNLRILRGGGGGVGAVEWGTQLHHNRIRLQHQATVHKKLDNLSSFCLVSLHGWSSCFYCQPFVSLRDFIKPVKTLFIYHRICPNHAHPKNTKTNTPHFHIKTIVLCHQKPFTHLPNIFFFFHPSHTHNCPPPTPFFKSLKTQEQ